MPKSAFTLKILKICILFFFTKCDHDNHNAATPPRLLRILHHTRTNILTEKGKNFTSISMPPLLAQFRVEQLPIYGEFKRTAAACNQCA